MTLKHAALALALAGTAAVAHAGVKASAYTLAHLYFPAGETFMPLNQAGATTVNFKLASSGKKVLTYSAVCGVSSQPGDTTAFVNLDIYVNGVVVAPTLGGFEFGEDPFCSANGTYGAGDGMVRASITIPIQGIAGNNTVRIKASTQGPASGFALGKSALVIHD